MTVTLRAIEWPFGRIIMLLIPKRLPLLLIRGKAADSKSLHNEGKHLPPTWGFVADQEVGHNLCLLALRRHAPSQMWEYFASNLHDQAAAKMRPQPAFHTLRLPGGWRFLTRALVHNRVGLLLGELKFGHRNRPEPSSITPSSGGWARAEWAWCMRPRIPNWADTWP